MNPKERLKSYIDWLVANLCRIKEYPADWLPHSVFVEEEDPNPVYRHYMLEAIRPDGTCDLHDPQTGKLVHDDYLLSAISVEWLVYLWDYYHSCCAQAGMAAVTALPFGDPQPEKELYAFVWYYDRLPRNATDQEILDAWDHNEELENARDDQAEDSETGDVDSWEDRHLIRKYTPDEFAALLNDECYSPSRYYVRFIPQPIKP